MCDCPGGGGYGVRRAGQGGGGDGVRRGRGGAEGTEGMGMGRADFADPTDIETPEHLQPFSGNSMCRLVISPMLPPS